MQSRAKGTTRDRGERKKKRLTQEMPHFLFKYSLLSHCRQSPLVRVFHDRTAATLPSRLCFPFSELQCREREGGRQSHCSPQQPQKKSLLGVLFLFFSPPSLPLHLPASFYLFPVLVSAFLFYSLTYQLSPTTTTEQESK
jgi:hypothetical protein